MVQSITFSNQLTAIFNYSIISYFVDTSRINVANLGIVSNVTSTYLGQARTVTYNFNPSGNDCNYTRYPSYKNGSDVDSLMELGDNTYFYTTQINTGILSTTHTYNFLHLELSHKVVIVISSNVATSVITNKYIDQDVHGLFPPLSELSINYQLSISCTNQVFDDQGNSLTSTVTNFYDNYGSFISVTSYKN